MKIIPLLLTLPLLILSTAFGAGCQGQPQPAAITILHTNDTHSFLDDAGRRATLIARARSDAGPDNVLLLDPGDVFTGTLYSTVFQGAADAWFMNYMKYDAMGVGQHEFDRGPEGLAKFAGEVQFPLVSSNIGVSAEPALAGKIKPWVILDRAGSRFGIFALGGEETAILSSPGPRVTIGDPTETARRAVAALQDRGINKIIALSHLGWDRDLLLAKQVPGIDVIIGGNTHMVPLKYPEVTGNLAEPTLVVQAGAQGKLLGRLQLTFDAAGVVRDWKGSSLLAVDEKTEADPECTARLAGYRGPIDALMKTIIGKTSVDLEGDRTLSRVQETNLGDLIADAMLKNAAPLHATIAIVNGGSIRASIPAGDVSMGHVFSVQPFGAYLVAVDMTGAQVIAALENGVSAVETAEGRFPQVSGLRFTWDPKSPPGSRIRTVEVKTAAGYALLSPAATYRVATTNFVAGGGDGYDVFLKAAGQVNIGAADYEMLAGYITADSPVGPRVEGRITRAG